MSSLYLQFFSQIGRNAKEQSEETMYTIQILVRCPHRYAEMSPQNIEQAEFVVESLVSLALLEIFSEVIVENVIMSYIPYEQEEATGNGMPHN